VDFTIADFVADARAPTPSAAAELVVPDRLACLEALGRSAQRLAGGMRRELRRLGARLENTERRLRLAHPGVRLSQQVQRLDELALRLSGGMHGRLHRQHARLADVRARLARCSPRHTVREYCAHEQQLRTRLDHAIRAHVARLAQRLALAQRGLHGVSPLATLSRGFAIVTDAHGALISDTATIDCGQQIEARLARGSLTARVTAKK
jgi:exodeoxyribonuclease VII large subunit